jgi:hypothetical protein
MTVRVGHKHTNIGRAQGGATSRFILNVHGHADRAQAALRDNHPALREGRTIFPTTVHSAKDAHHVLISGHDNGKLGAVVSKGAWAGMPMYHLSLEERATCPRSCQQWDTCFGNAMPLAKRWRFDGHLRTALDRDLERLDVQHPHGYVVRLHVLGDFPNRLYVAAWAAWLQQHPLLRIWGYTAHLRESETGFAIAHLTLVYPERFRIRFSVGAGAPHGPAQTTVLWRQPESHRVPEGLVCPLQLQKTRTCGSCALCWSPAAENQRIVFVGHGMRKSAGPRVKKPEPKDRAMPEQAAAPPPTTAALPPAPAAPFVVVFRHEITIAPESLKALNELARAMAQAIASDVPAITGLDAVITRPSAPVAEAAPPAVAPFGGTRWADLTPETVDKIEKELGLPLAADPSALKLTLPEGETAFVTDPRRMGVGAARPSSAEVVRAEAPPAKVRPVAPSEPTWNGERDAVIRRRYPRGDGIRAILDECNALPGPRIKDNTLVYARANSLGLRRESPDPAPPASAVLEERPRVEPPPPKPSVRAALEMALFWAKDQAGPPPASITTRAQLVGWINKMRQEEGLATFLVWDMGDPNEAWPKQPHKPAPPAPTKAEIMARVAGGAEEIFHPAAWPEIRSWCRRHAPAVATAGLSSINAARKQKGLKAYRLVSPDPMVHRLDAGREAGAP